MGEIVLEDGSGEARVLTVDAAGVRGEEPCRGSELEMRGSKTWFWKAGGMRCWYVLVCFGMFYAVSTL